MTTTPERRVPDRSHKLSYARQMQVCRWHLEQYGYADASKLMVELWGFAIARQTWDYYRSRHDLLRQAQDDVKEQYERFGLSQRELRIKVLADHLADLLAIKRNRGLFQFTQQMIGFGKDAIPVTNEEFDAQLSREIRETTKLIDHLMAPVERIIQNVDKQIVITPEMAERLGQVARAMNLPIAGRTEVIEAVSATAPEIHEEENHAPATDRLLPPEAPRPAGTPPAV